jgi:hypothetical protein
MNTILAVVVLCAVMIVLGWVLLLPAKWLAGVSEKVAVFYRHLVVGGLAAVMLLQGLGTVAVTSNPSTWQSTKMWLSSSAEQQNAATGQIGMLLAVIGGCVLLIALASAWYKIVVPQLTNIRAWLAKREASKPADGNCQHED